MMLDLNGREAVHGTHICRRKVGEKLFLPLARPSLAQLLFITMLLD